jgi:hypothetical protein
LGREKDDTDDPKGPDLVIRSILVKGTVPDGPSTQYLIVMGCVL